jgi:ribosome maturation protein Sdo1
VRDRIYLVEHKERRAMLEHAVAEYEELRENTVVPAGCSPIPELRIEDALDHYRYHVAPKYQLHFVKK